MLIVITGVAYSQFHLPRVIQAEEQIGWPSSLRTRREDNGLSVSLALRAVFADAVSILSLLLND